MNQPLAETIFWIAALACVVAEIAILRSIIAQRRAQNPTLVPAASRVMEIVWGILPAIALSFLLVATWRRIQARETHMHMNHGAHDMTASLRDAGSGTRDAH
ncbi:MAG TPA: hypothetical protein VJ840_11035 [Gemmatimonadaceae bacterium]|nr:hypothetical protein [Gemmatimonadaceae bacterium]